MRSSRSRSPPSPIRTFPPESSPRQYADLIAEAKLSPISHCTGASTTSSSASPSTTPRVPPEKPKGVMYSHRGAYLNSLGETFHNGFDGATKYLWTTADVPLQRVVHAVGRHSGRGHTHLPARGPRRCDLGRHRQSGRDTSVRRSYRLLHHRRRRPGPQGRRLAHHHRRRLPRHRRSSENSKTSVSPSFTSTASPRYTAPTRSANTRKPGTTSRSPSAPHFSLVRESAWCRPKMLALSMPR